MIRAVVELASEQV